MNNYQWYPGHMTKAKRAMQEDIALVDLVIEILDARIPLSSRNPDIDTLAKNKSRMVLLNKADLALESCTKQWCEYFKQKGIAVLTLDARNKGLVKKTDALVKEACREKIERMRAKGITGRPIRAMVCGIPNVGKSTFINSFAGRACAKTGNKPGVTKGKQWIKLSKTLELLDTPGILWPKFEDRTVGEHLAFIGSMNDQILDMQELALSLLAFIEENYAGVIDERYKAENLVLPPEIAEAINPYAKKLYQIAISRHCLKKGNEPDYDRAANIFLDDFRAGRVGNITIEKADEA